jgi:hypothetical protein
MALTRAIAGGSRVVLRRVRTWSVSRGFAFGSSGAGWLLPHAVQSRGSEEVVLALVRILDYIQTGSNFSGPNVLVGRAHQSAREHIASFSSLPQKLADDVRPRLHDVQNLVLEVRFVCWSAVPEPTGFSQWSRGIDRQNSDYWQRVWPKGHVARPGKYRKAHHGFPIDSHPALLDWSHSLQ